MKKFLSIFVVSYLYGQWEPDVRITNYPNHYDYGSPNNAWTIAVKDSFVHIVWERRLGNNPGELYYVRSTTYGTNFESHQQLTTRDSHFPSISVWDSFVYIVWEDRRDGNSQIYYNRSKDYGSTWDINNFRLTTNTPASRSPSISSSDSFVHIVWVDGRDGNGEIYYNRSKDYGRTWDINNFRLTINTAESKYPSISSSDSFVYIVWCDERDGNEEIYYNRSKDYGRTWDINNFRLTINPAVSWRPSISSSDSFVHIVWEDRRDGNSEIYYNRSKDYGRTWDIDNFRLTIALQHSRFPSICVVDSFVHIIWIDLRDGSDNIYYKMSKNYGNSWTEDEKLTTDASYCPSVACRRCPPYDVHIVWTDTRHNNWEIYYKHHKCPPTGIESKITKLNQFSYIGKIKFYLELEEQAVIELKIFDIMGRLIDRINKNYNKGRHTIVWKNNQGIYFFLFKINNDKKLIKGIIL